jgi:hypothetical protein
MYKIGDTILLNEPFNLWNVNTWLNPFVKFFINLWHKVRGVAYVDYSHALIVADYQGQMYAWEAVANGFVPTKPIEQRLKGIEHLILRPRFFINESKVNLECQKLEGTPYDFEGVFNQLEYRVTTTWRFVNEQNFAKKFYCTEVIAYIYFQVNEFPKDWYKWSQKEFYFSPYFTHKKINTR